MMAGRSVLALAIVAIAAAATATAAVEVNKCGGCSPCGGADCPVLYPSPPPPAIPPPPPYYYYSPPPPATYPAGGSGGCPPPPGAYIQIGSTPPGKGPLYPQDPGFMPNSAPGRVAAPSLTVAAAIAAVACAAWAFL